jgi:hypothetical protein
LLRLLGKAKYTVLRKSIDEGVDVSPMEHPLYGAEESMRLLR